MPLIHNFCRVVPWNDPTRGNQYFPFPMGPLLLDNRAYFDAHSYDRYFTGAALDNF